MKIGILRKIKISLVLGVYKYASALVAIFIFHNTPILIKILVPIIDADFISIKNSEMQGNLILKRGGVLLLALAFLIIKLAKQVAVFH